MIINAVIGFESLMAQHRPVQILESVLRTGNIPHALLFTGVDGVGKTTAAMAFAMALNCLNRPKEEGTSPEGGAPLAGCDCRSCRKIDSGLHPDVLTVHPAGPFIRIDQIRELCRVLAMKPYEARYRVAVISDAHRMNPEAGNALLKMLEEPPEHTILILTASGAADMLPTLVSRCRHIRFQPIPTSLLSDAISKKWGMDREKAMGIAALAAGSLAKALSLPETNWIRRRAWLIEMLVALNRGEVPLSRLLGAAALLSDDKDLTLDSLNVMESVYRDMLVCPHTREHLMNPDMTAEIASVAGKGGEGRALTAIGRARERIRANAGLRLTLEALFLTLAKCPEMN